MMIFSYFTMLSNFPIPHTSLLSNVLTIFDTISKIIFTKTGSFSGRLDMKISIGIDTIDTLKHPNHSISRNLALS